ncbi:MAG TPA: hypothetical protein VF043_38940 [Ktedonobacteraceae bacterium]
MTDDVIVVIGCFLFFILLFLPGMLVLKAPAGQKRLFFFAGLVVSAGTDLLLILGFLEYWVLTRLSLLSLHSLHILALIGAPTGVIFYFFGVAGLNSTRIIPGFEEMRALLSFCLVRYICIVLFVIALNPLLVMPALFPSLQVPIVLLFASIVLFASGLQGAFAVFRFHVTWRSSRFGWALARIIGGILLFLVILQMFLQLE